MENGPRNLTIGTLIRVAHALDSRAEIKLVRRKGTKAGRGRNGGGKSRVAAFELKAAAAGDFFTRIGEFRLSVSASFPLSFDA